MKNFRLTFSYTVAAAVVIGFIGCGGGGGSSSTDPVPSTTGIVADGYLVGAKVCVDRNRNDVCDTGEPSAITDETGRYSFFNLTAADLTLPLIVEADENTIDLDTHAPIGEKWHFKGITGSSFISPLTTLVASDMELYGLTGDVAMERLKNDLGLDINVTIDYIAANNTLTHTKAKIIALNLANAERELSEAAPAEDPRIIRLLAAKLVRAQTYAIITNAETENLDYRITIDPADVPALITEITNELDGTTPTPDPDPLPTTLSAQLQADLLFMWEEEKLARDVYTLMYQTYGVKIFSSIAMSEQSHMNSVKQMIDKYYVDVAGRDTTAGTYVNADLQALYNTLVAKGNISLTDAYEVGVLIEETDIQDLNDRLAAEGLPSDIKDVYESLRSGSYNHLAAFSSKLP